VEDWLACEVCHRLIVAGDRNGLARRSLSAPGMQMAVAFLGWAAALRYCRDLHDRFSTLRPENGATRECARQMTWSSVVG
jgi:hypothetical protein